MKAELEIHRMLALSTGHVTKETSEKLNVEECGAYNKSEYGWFIRAADDDEFPPDLRACIQFANKQGCDWLMFDCDGLIIEGLPTYDW